MALIESFVSPIKFLLSVLKFCEFIKQDLKFNCEFFQIFIWFEFVIIRHQNVREISFHRLFNIWIERENINEIAPNSEAKLDETLNLLETFFF